MDRLRTERHPGVWHIGVDWKATALEAEVLWVETVTEGGRRLMIAWRKEGIDRLGIAMRRERQRDYWGKSLSHTEIYKFAKRHPLLA